MWEMVTSREFIWLEHNGSYKFYTLHDLFFHILMSFAAFLKMGSVLDVTLSMTLIPISSQTGSWFVSYWTKIDNIYDKIDDAAWSCVVCWKRIDTVICWHWNKYAHV